MQIYHLQEGSSLAEVPEGLQKSKKSFLFCSYCYEYACECICDTLPMGTYDNVVVRMNVLYLSTPPAAATAAPTALLADDRSRDCRFDDGHPENTSQVR